MTATGKYAWQGDIPVADVQRFESELNARQNLVKQLQLELQTARAEHAAIQAERDRRLSEQERRVAQIQRELDAATEQITRRRGWFWRR